MRKTFFCALAVVCTTIGHGQVAVAKIFADSMVLQRGIPVPIWGTAGSGEKVTVRFNRQTKNCISDAKGKWRADLGPEKEGGPYQLLIEGSSNAITIKDVLVGDVWICSGQSNMEFVVRTGKNSEEEIRNAHYPMIRHVKISTTVAETPREDLGNNNGWHSAVPAFTGDFTAVGYFFARKLYEELHVPIGLINTTWGGTDVETWTSREALARDPEFAGMIAALPSLNIDSLAAVREKTMLAQIGKLQGGIPAPSQAEQWKDASFNDASWPKMQIPGLWEQHVLQNFDGVVWFRKTIDLSAEEAKNTIDISLGMIDDNDVTYINGEKVGATNGYNVKRIYRIPPGLLHEGKNTIAVRVEDTGGGGGIYGDADDLKLSGKGSRSIAGEWLFQVESIIKANSVGPNSYPSLLFNAMVNPLIPYAIRGVIWYQGENNAGRAFQYRTAFPLMIRDWRARWKQGDFPFYFVQLASYNAGGGNSSKGSNWAELREAQALTLGVPHTGMAVTTDIGESKDIHPKNKQDVGLRLAAVALHDAYGRQNEYSGPVYSSMNISGGTVRVSFTHRGAGLITTDPAGQVKGFEVAGADKIFYPAVAVIEGDHVNVSSPSVASPVAVRYAWADDAGDANLYNLERLPAAPFRTDSWKGITEANRYRISGK